MKLWIEFMAEKKSDFGLKKIKFWIDDFGSPQQTSLLWIENTKDLPLLPIRN